MRTIVTVFLIICFLILFIAGEYFYVDGFCTEFIEEINKLDKEINSGNNPEEQAERIVSIWENSKQIIFIFENHNNFQEIETGIYNLQYCITNKTHSEAEFYLDSLYHRVTELKESIRFTTGNIL